MIGFDHFMNIVLDRLNIIILEQSSIQIDKTKILVRL